MSAPASWRRLLRSVVRESRGQRRRLALFVASLAVGVAAVVAVAGLAASLDSAIRREARALLAADLRIASRQPIPDAVTTVLASVPGAERVDVKQMPTVVAAPRTDGPGEPGPSRLVELKAVSAGYPFYGRLDLEPARPLAELLTPESAVIAPELAAALELEIGDPLRIGGESFRVAGLVRSEPDRVGALFTLGPRVFVSLAGLERSGLETFGSRVRYRALVRLPQADGGPALETVAERLKTELGKDGHYRVETYSEAQPGLRRNLDRLERFLGLVALLSLLAGGIGVAQTVRSWIAERLDAIAVLKCLGMTPREVVAIYLGQAALLGLVGGALGALAGTAVIAAVPALLGGLIPPAAVDPVQPLAILRGLALGVGAAVLFSLAPLADVLQVPPVRVLRRDAEPLAGDPRVRRGVLGAVGGGLLALAATQSGSLTWGLGFLAGLAAVSGVLAAAALILTRRLVPALVHRLPTGAASLWLRHGVAAVGRPGAGTLGAVIALGLGVLVVVAMALVEDHLTARLTADLPRDAPNVFLIDIQPDQWPDVERRLAAAGARRIDSVPVVTARLTAVDGTSSAELAEATEDGDRRWALTREQRLTYLAELPADNRLLAGALWSLPGQPEVSVEQEFAEDLEVDVGSRLTLDVQGVPLELAVSSRRQVDWESFGINFYLVVEPGVLDEAPQQRLAAAQLADDAIQPFQDRLAAAYPNVTLLDLRQVLGKVLAVLERVSLGVRLLGGFTVLAAIAILAGAVSAGAVRRGREVALLKTLGLTRGAVAAVMAVEYALVGLVAGVLGTAGGGVLAWAVLTRGMEVDWTWHPATFAAAVAGAVALAVLAGLAVSLRPLTVRPVEVLRS